MLKAARITRLAYIKAVLICQNTYIKGCNKLENIYIKTQILSCYLGEKLKMCPLTKIAKFVAKYLAIFVRKKIAKTLRKSRHIWSHWFWSNFACCNLTLGWPAAQGCQQFQGQKISFNAWLPLLRNCMRKSRVH